VGHAGGPDHSRRVEHAAPRAHAPLRTYIARLATRMSLEHSKIRRM
jgi:hypothetical protein